MIFTFDFIQRFCDNLGKVLGPNCEIVIHDFTGDLEHTIVYIVNGENSGRQVGDSPTNLFFEYMQSIKEKKEEFSEYYTTTESGRTIRSSTTFLENESGDVVGAICVNLDITELISFNKSLNLMIGNEKSSSIGNEKYFRNVQELMDYYLEDIVRKIGKPADQMDKSEKIRALAYLDSKGITQIFKAHIKLCDFFDISKYTLYNYLDEARNRPVESDQDL